MLLDLDGDYVLTADIDCNGFSFEPVGNPGSPFTGTFDGDGHSISNLAPDALYSSYAGLFGKTDGAVVHDVRLLNVTISGIYNIGSLIGSGEDTEVFNVSVESFTVSGDEYIGGLIGDFSGGSVRRSFSANGNVDVDREAGGGLIGTLSTGVFEALYSRDSVITGTNADYVGGLIGYASAGFSGLSVSDTFSNNTVTGGWGAGGVIGGMGGGAVSCEVRDSFSAAAVTGNGSVGALVGRTAALCNVVDGVFLSGNCVGDDYSSGDSTCTAAGAESDFYDADNAPLSSWDFATAWIQTVGDFPTFYWTDSSLPGAPTNVEAASSATSLTLTWTNPADVDFHSITIRRGTSGYPSSVTAGTAVASNLTGTTYTDTGLAGGARYYYSLFARNTGGEYGPAGTVTEIVGRNACLLEAYWKFDASPSAPADATGNGYAGTPSGSLSLSEDVPVTGFVNPYSFAFDGTTASVDVSRPVEDDFTLCAWVKTTAQGAGAGTQHYLSRAIMHAEAGGLDNDFGFGMDANERLTFGDGSSSSDYGVHGTSVINTGNWTHVCATRRKDNGAMKVYVNGTEEGAGTGSTTSLTANSTLTIGNGTDGALRWNGLIDDVRVYAYALHADEIADIANGVNACFGEATPRPSVSTSTASEERSGGGGGARRGSTERVVQKLSERVTASPAGTVRPAAGAAPARESMPSALRDRTCERVMKWFRGNATMLGRVNARLEKRFGFTCTSEG